jgi:hypothetical protein
MSPPRRPDLADDDDGFRLLDSFSMTPAMACKVSGWSRSQLYVELKGRVRSYTLGRARYVETASLRERIAELAAEAQPLRPEPRFGGREGRRDGLRKQQVQKIPAKPRH